jgi:class 3 adenylate cyclase
VNPGSTPFLTDDVAKAKKKREIIRIFVLSLLSCTFAGLSGAHPARDVSRAVLFDGVPFALLLVTARHLVPLVKLRSIGWMILFRGTAYTFVFASMVFLIFLTLMPGRDLSEGIPIIRTVLATSYLCVLLALATRGVARKLGPGAFKNWIRGYYYTPKEEERIFMFLDMRRSTELAESLGDMKFSKLVQDFFDDLTGPIIETCAEVSHYIGDEAVLTWWPKQGLPEARCLQCFFRMQLIIDRRRAYYLQEYGIVPEFKAGAHIGNVVATEVGKIKSEIVFHGDVLNTTARVQGACSEFGSDLLITEALAKRLPSMPWLDLQQIGGVALKGKSEKVQLLSATVRSK